MVGMIPNVPMAEALHRQYAPSQAAYELIHTHCQIIAALAVRMADQVNERLLRGDDLEGVLPERPLNRDLVRTGALLHDIGTYRILKDDGSKGRPLTFQGERYIEHGLEGYRLLLDAGVDESVAQFARNHTGVGLPPDDYLPVNPEQEVVMYADKFHSKHQPPIFVSQPTAAKRTAKYGPDNLARWKQLVARYGVPDLQPLAKHYGMTIV